jgi:hypothetical protein
MYRVELKVIFDVRKTRNPNRFLMYRVELKGMSETGRSGGYIYVVPWFL